MSMKVTLELSDTIVESIENKLNEKLPGVLEDVLQDNIDEILKDVVIKQLRSCALIYIQGQEFRAKLLDKVKPAVNEMVGIK